MQNGALEEAVTWLLQIRQEPVLFVNALVVQDFVMDVWKLHILQSVVNYLKNGTKSVKIKEMKKLNSILPG